MQISLNGRSLLNRVNGVGLGLVLLLSPLVHAGDQEASVRTFTYKKVGNLEIKADVLRLENNRTQPLVLWFHGGSLINGSRDRIDPPLKKMLLEAGYTIVSADYRLAPETKLPALIEDIEDAYQWVRQQGPELYNVSTKRIAVMGSSAGGYLALTAGFRAKPRPAVVVSIAGYGDLVGSWVSRPSPHPRHHKRTMTDAEADKVMNGPPISETKDRQGDGSTFKHYTRQRGTWSYVVSGFNPHTEPEKFISYMAVRNVTQDYPPTMLIHGTCDTDVPHEQAEMMAAEFDKHGVPYKLISIPNSEHGFDGAAEADVLRAYESAVQFTSKHVK